MSPLQLYSRGNRLILCQISAHSVLLPCSSYSRDGGSFSSTAFQVTTDACLGQRSVRHCTQAFRSCHRGSKLTEA